MWYDKIVAVDTPITRLIKDRLGPGFEKRSRPRRPDVRPDRGGRDPSIRRSMKTVELYRGRRCQSRPQLRRLGRRAAAVAGRRRGAQKMMVQTDLDLDEFIRLYVERVTQIVPGNPTGSVTSSRHQEESRMSRRTAHRRRRQRERRPHHLRRQFSAPGQTIFGQDFDLGFGGKGANQAVAARLCGAQVSMVARVGVGPLRPGDDQELRVAGHRRVARARGRGGLERRRADLRRAERPESDLRRQGSQRPADAGRRRRSRAAC